MDEINVINLRKEAERARWFATHLSDEFAYSQLIAFAEKLEQEIQRVEARVLILERNISTPLGGTQTVVAAVEPLPSDEPKIEI